MIDRHHCIVMASDNRWMNERLLVAHLFNHQSHHRGQLTTLLSQLGRDPGSTDLPFAPGAAQMHGAAG